MEHPRISTPDKTLDELVTLLSCPRCRSLLWYLQQSSGEVYALRHLAKILAQEDEENMWANEVTVELQHMTLPRLEDAGIIEYDPRSKTVRYHGRSELEALFDMIAERRSMADIRP